MGVCLLIILRVGSALWVLAWSLFCCYQGTARLAVSDKVSVSLLRTIVVHAHDALVPFVQELLQTFLSQRLAFSVCFPHETVFILQTVLKE